MKALVDSVRKAEPNVLLADAGDFVQGTYYFSLLDGIVEMKIMDALGYDVRTIGNHEFDKKMPGLGNMLSWSSVTTVATNYDFSNTLLSSQVLPSTIVEAGGRKIGFIGLNVRLQSLVDPMACEGVLWQDAVNVADSEARKLRSAGAEMVIALSHLGFEYENDRPYYDIGFVKNTREIDMVIGGHSHTTLSKPCYVTNLAGRSVPIGQTGSKGLNLGYSKVRFDSNGIPSFTYRLIPVNKRLDDRIDQQFSSMIDTYTDQLSGQMSEVLGYSPYTLWKNSPESELSNIAADAIVWMAKEYYDIDADVSIYNWGGIRSNLPAGNITLGDVYEVFPFDNVLSILTMKGSDLRTFFAHVASDGGLPINSAVRLKIRNREVVSVTVHGEPIDDNKVYTVATVDYLVNTGRYGFEKALTRRDTQEIVRDYYGEYLKYLASQNTRGEIVVPIDGRIVILD
jgi:5'-nucleotidase